MSDELSTIYRILDASANRASEGLRTLEELARFGLDNAAITAEVKALRHQLTAALQTIPRSQLLAARDTEGDVGTRLQEPSEYQRKDLAAIMQAASARVQQSLRVMEEGSKPLDSEIARRLEQIRYQSYTVSAKLELLWPTRERARRLNDAKLYVLVDAGTNESQFEHTLLELCRGGVDIIQLRDRQVDDRTLIDRGRLGARLAREHGALFIMNDRADLALASDCDGVHVGQEELPVHIARQIVGSQRLIGVSTHSIEQAKQAMAEGADYIGCGPVFPGRTKQFEHYVGIELLKQVTSEVELPAFAIGGIDATNLSQVIAAGFRRIAVTGAVRDAEDPAVAAQELKQRLA
jgi:thiamine-phosphate pyrophosphorylase